MTHKRYGDRGRPLSEEATAAGVRAFNAERRARIRGAAAAEAVAKAERRAQLERATAERLRRELEAARAETRKWRHRALLFAADNDTLKLCIAKGGVPGWKITREGRPAPITTPNNEKETTR